MLAAHARRGEFGLPSGHGVARFRLCIAVDHFERDRLTVLLRELDQAARDGRRRLALAPLELRDSRLPQFEAFGESGLREPEALADGGECVHENYSSRAVILSQPSARLFAR